MKQKKKLKIIETSLILVFLVLLLAQTGYSQLSVYLEGSNIQLTAENGGILGFGTETGGITVTVTSGTLNGTATMKYLYNSGTVTVASEDTASFTIDGVGQGIPRFGGGQTANQINKTRILGTTINGDNLIFGWGIELEPLLPIMFILGVCGVMIFFVGLTWGAYTMKNGEYIEGAVRALIFCSIGFGLILGWLYQ